MEYRKKWVFNVCREATVFAGAGMTYAFGISKSVGIPFQYENVRYIDSEWWFEAGEFDELNNILTESFRHNRKEYDKIIRDQYRTGEHLKRYIKSLDNKYTINTDLKATYNEYIEKLLEFYSFYVFPTVAGEIVEKEVKKIVESNDIDVDFADLVHPHRRLNSNKARIELFKIGVNPSFRTVKSFDDLDVRMKTKLQKHADLYGWESYSFHVGEPLKSEDYFRKIREEGDCSAVLDTYADQDRKRAKDDALLKSSLSRKKYDVIKLLQKIIYFRNYQKETMNECQYRSIPFLTEIADRIGMTFSELQMFSPFEIRDALSGKRLDIRGTKKRHEGFEVVLEDGVIAISGRKPEPEKFTGKRKDFSGQAAHGGRAEGKVRIVMSKGELEGFEDGEILVTSMTSVDYVGILKKARAIITDEGGVTCHAAIFSREFDIPCVIGTKIATKTLRSGDYVEVDADNGMIRILEQ